jgi:hypothetical protein
MAQTYSLSDVFISYSRKDKAFVLRLNDRLQAHGQEAWVDWEDIPPTADWWNEIQAGIDGANTFVFIISPNSVMSEVCYREVEYAVSAGKRFVPVLYQEVTDPAHQAKMHPSIGSHNWLMFQDESAFDSNFERLIEALETDLDYVRNHTRLLVRAREWDMRGRDSSFLLSGTAVREAQEWQVRSAGMKPAPTALQSQYILASEQAQASRQRRILAGVSVALAVAVALAILSFVLYGQSEGNRAQAIANAALAATNESIAVTNAQEAQYQAATSDVNATLANINALIARTNEAEAFARGTAVANQAATSAANADLAATNAAIASTNEAEAFLRGTAVANQAATSDINATLANANALIAGTNEARAEANAAIASTNEAEAFLRGTAVANQAATSAANANLAATNAAEAEAQARRADIARRQSQAIALAADAEIALINNADDTEFATLIGIEALANYPYTWEAERILGMVIPTGFEPVAESELPPALNDPLLAPDGVTELAILENLPQQAVILYPDGRTQVLIGHTDDITGAAWSPDGTRIATISADTTVRIWDAQTGQPVRTLFAHEDVVDTLAWSPDGLRLVTASRDGAVNIWNVAGSVLPLALMADRDDIDEVIFSEDSLYMVSLDGEAFRWQLWASPDELLARARSSVTRRLTDEEAAFVGLPPAPSAPPPDVIEGCADALTSQLYPGVFARVSSKNNLLPLNLRDAAGLDGRIVAKIAPDQTFQVLNGPVCQDNFAWFEVVYGLDGQRGWVAEGAMTSSGPDYFAEPIPGR